MNTLRKIANRPRTIEPADTAAANLYHERLTAQAAEYLSRIWRADELGKFPYPSNINALPVDSPKRTRDWADSFDRIVHSLRSDFPGEISVAGSGRFAIVLRADPVTKTARTLLEGFRHVAEDLKERSRDAADVCEWLANKLSEEPDGAAGSTPVQQVEHLEQ